MTALSEDKILRVNCPGFGTSSILPLGEAKPLAMYDVIVVNPTSVLHLFDNQSDTIKQIEILQADGMTSHRTDSDSVIEDVMSELEMRSSELGQFLKKGGLLIFFLTPPFSVSGPTQVMDNYSWLGEWAPDKPAGPNQRNMSATIRGKAIETSPDAAQTPWVPYLKQQGIEWSTIIRLENLSDGWVPLANAGPNKCIAGYKASGPKGGQVVFLPAPYDQNYDAKLRECIERWYTAHNEASEAASGSSAALADLNRSLSSLLSDDEPAAPTPASAPEPVAAASSELDMNSDSGMPSVFDIPGSEDDELEKLLEEAAPESVAAAPQVEFFSHEPTPVAETPNKTNGNSSNGNNGNGAYNADSGEPKELINKMKQEVSKHNAPDWCQKFTFEELDGLRTQLEDLNEEIRLAKLKVADIESRISLMDDLKNSLLSASGDQLTASVTRVFERLGWTVKTPAHPEELWLLDGDKTQAIVRLNYSHGTPNRSELASLAESVINYWGTHDIEPKGILVASTHAELPPNERPEEDFPESMCEFAKRKNLALLTTAQLLLAYRDIDTGGQDEKSVRENLLTTMGRVTEYEFSAKKNTTSGRRK